jgi:hypothetical protein
MTRNRLAGLAAAVALAAVVVLAFSSTADAQRVDDFRGSIIETSSAEFDQGAPDGGFRASGCASMTSLDGGVTLSTCAAPFNARTVAQRNAFSACMAIGEQVWARENRARADAGL